MAVSDVVEAVKSLSNEERLQLKILVNFSDVVEAVKSLSIEEKQQLLLLLQNYIQEESREEIYQEIQAAKLEAQNGELKFSSNIEELKQLIKC